MARKLDLDALLGGCADSSLDDGIRIDTELAPLAGPGSPVKPAVYEGGTYQQDQRWANPADEEPTPVIVIDNVPAQANRLEDALRQNRESAGIPEFLLDLSGLKHLPVHLPRHLSSLQFPHRNGDAYLRDAILDGEDFIKTEIGQSIFGATAQTCGPLVAWFPQALLYGFWQSHLGRKRQNTKHARAWVSEIVGWRPASSNTRTQAVKGDPLNLSIGEDIWSDKSDRTRWDIGDSGKASGGTKEKLSEIGHGQVLSTGRDAAAAAVSFARVTQRATVSFAQLRRIRLDEEHSGAADAAVRALLVALGLHAHQLAFARGFALRSGAELRPNATRATWLGPDGDDELEFGDAAATAELLRSARAHAESNGVPLDGWRAEPIVLLPKENLKKAILSTWPELAD